MVPILFIAVMITFTLGFYAPGDPIRLMFGEDRPVNEEVRLRIRHQYGLDRPYPVQLGDYMFKLLQGDFGKSIALNRSVGITIAHALPVSAQLGLTALAMMLLIGIPLGVLAAV